MFFSLIPILFLNPQSKYVYHLRYLERHLPHSSSKRLQFNFDHTVDIIPDLESQLLKRFRKDVEYLKQNEKLVKGKNNG